MVIRRVRNITLFATSMYCINIQCKKLQTHKSSGSLPAQVYAQQAGQKVLEIGKWGSRGHGSDGVVKI